MHQYCSLGNHGFDDGVECKPMSKEDWLAELGIHEQVACKDCWSKFEEDAEKLITQIKNGEIDIHEINKQVAARLNNSSNRESGKSVEITRKDNEDSFVFEVNIVDVDD